MFGIDKLIGGGIDKLAESFGLPEVVGDIAKIGVGYFTANPALMMDGIMDIAPNVLDMAGQALDLGGAEPGKPKGSKGSKKDGLNLLQGLLGGVGGGSGGGGDILGKVLGGALG